MPSNSVILEEYRLKGNDTGEKPLFRERHRIFPDIIKKRNHKRIIDVAAGIGYVAERISNNYSECQFFCNDLSPTCLQNLKKLQIPVVNFDLDTANGGFPFSSGSFDGVIALATIEHIIQVDDFIKEIARILEPEGCLYLSAPNYASLLYMTPFLFTGRTFHNPLDKNTRYEFYAHVRYFTYQTLLEFIPQFGFLPETVYLPVPGKSTIYSQIYSKSRLTAWMYKYGLTFMYWLSPRWASEPVFCFRKTTRPSIPFKKIIL